jgi:hypothetical protein
LFHREYADGKEKLSPGDYILLENYCGKLLFGLKVCVEELHLSVSNNAGKITSKIYAPL